MMLIMLYYIKTIEVNYELEAMSTDYSNDRCYNSSDRAQTVKWKSEYLYNNISFNSEFTKIVLGNKTNSFYVAVRLYGHIIASDRTVIAKLDHSFFHSPWNYSKAESSMPGSFM